MIATNFYDQSALDDGLFRFAVIAARYNGKWIFCRHKLRETWEIPGGHRDQVDGAWEDITETARRELYEETGALDFDIRPVLAYSVTDGGETSYGMLYLADVKTLGPLPPEMEIGEIRFADVMPDKLTYSEIQPHLFEKVRLL